MNYQIEKRFNENTQSYCDVVEIKSNITTVGEAVTFIKENEDNIIKLFSDGYEEIFIDEYCLKKSYATWSLFKNGKFEGDIFYQD